MAKNCFECKGKIDAGAYRLINGIPICSRKCGILSGLMEKIEVKRDRSLEVKRYLIKKELKMKSLMGCILLVFIMGCSNANLARFSALGKRHDVKCYSGGVVIYEGHSTGKIENEHQSDGYYFQDEQTGKFVTVSGNCVITVAR